jgi:hypothetical protein
VRGGCGGVQSGEMFGALIRPRLTQRVSVQSPLRNHQGKGLSEFNWSQSLEHALLFGKLVEINSGNTGTSQYPLPPCFDLAQFMALSTPICVKPSS